MKFILATLPVLVAAHSAVWKVTFDGTTYPARDARMDPELGAKRAEWHFKNVQNFPWMAVRDVEDASITCGLDATPPDLSAKARAGANVTVQWSGIIRMHLGPVLTYLGRLPTPDTKPLDISFFKINEAGFDKARRKWANEDLIEHGTADTFQLPSDIKPGTYVLRTELLALHGNRMNYLPQDGYSGPQFYTHCFNVEILGNGNVEPAGVKFPGGYKRDEPGVKFNLYKSEKDWDGYIIPGPPKYAGKYEAPTGEPPKVEPKDTGLFPPAFQAKYEAYKAKEDEYAIASSNMVNGVDPTGKEMAKGSASIATYFQGRTKVQAALKEEYKNLLAEAKALGIAPK
ncbi:hypothetical protein EJ06DRAFT_526096 [Trichodelitschia bisporula]|uniref:AA9 family lytic polysaccharide monooxygenase n=1 Tax=Trichodelitschia bisporula TaxID=703511 RepID=A0A6G1IBK9_9PEZI|nr:hypothetical protein EJ06DRAFT_526096 [Trichodelitschia bisporula]